MSIHKLILSLEKKFRPTMLIMVITYNSTQRKLFSGPCHQNTTGDCSGRFDLWLGLKRGSNVE